MSKSLIKSSPFKGDLTIWAIFFTLCAISLVEVFSAGSSLTYKSGTFWQPLIRQAAFLVGGTLVVYFIHNIPQRYFKIFPILGIPTSIMLLLYTSVSGAVINGSQRLITFLGIQFQPSEVAKLMLIIAVALTLAYNQREKCADKRVFKWILVMGGIICFLIFTENFSTAGILFAVIVAMMYIGRVSYRQLAKLMLAVATAAIVFGGTLKMMPDNPDSAIYQSKVTHRIPTWKKRLFGGSDMVKTRNPKDFEVTDDNSQKVHARIAVSSARGIGCMPGNSTERDFLSQAYSDFIFAIIAEEMGLWGTGLVVFLYIALLIRAARIAGRCDKYFPAFLVMGLALLLVFQACINMMVAVGLFPVTGQPLPLISRGGTSTLITSVYFGMILSVSRYARREEGEYAIPTHVAAEQSEDIAQSFRSDEGIK